MYGLVVGVILGELALYSQLASHGYNPLLIVVIVLASAAWIIWGGSKLASKHSKVEKGSKDELTK